MPASKQSRSQQPPANRGSLYRLVSLALLLLFAAGCRSSTDVLLSDAMMTTQLQAEKAALLTLIDACENNATPYDLAERYREANGLIAIASLAPLEGCELSSDSPNAYPLKYLAKDTAGETYLLVTNQYRKGTGWIEESASKWTAGWVSWKSAILEEKGFLYVPQGELGLANTPFPNLSIVTDPLDQFTGKYRVTSQISGNSSCEVWRLRPIEPNWYLFYHQSRECPA